jgi:multisubunit Na+/H+ antiporter MnhB subunit
VTDESMTDESMTDGTSTPTGADDSAAGDFSRSRIFDTVVGAAFHTTVLVSLFLLARGHNAPGGGFVGGLVCAVALILVYLADGPVALRRILPTPPYVIAGAGLLVALATGIGSLLTGGAFLESTIIKQKLPAIGTVKVTTASVYDVGVFLLVVGVVVIIALALSNADPTATADELEASSAPAAEPEDDA